MSAPQTSFIRAEVQHLCACLVVPEMNKEELSLRGTGYGLGKGISEMSRPPDQSMNDNQLPQLYSQQLSGHSRKSAQASHYMS